MKTECGRFMVDSNILIYLADQTENEKHVITEQWFTDNESTHLCISHQNLREFANICLARKLISTKKILAFLDAFTARFIVIQDDFLDTKNAVKLSNGNQNLFWDAAIVSVMKRNHVETIFTENTKDFNSLGVKAINPLK